MLADGLKYFSLSMKYGALFLEDQYLDFKISTTYTCAR